MLEVLLLKPRRWPFAVSYGWWSFSQRCREWLGLRWARVKDMADLVVRTAISIVGKAMSVVRRVAAKSGLRTRPRQ
jgi:hypothetical protein